MQHHPDWRRTPLYDITKTEPSEHERVINATHNAMVLDDWGVPESQRYTRVQTNAMPSALGDGGNNMTVWFSSITSLVDQATTSGLVVSDSEFVDVGCGVGLAALWAVAGLGFARALGIEYDGHRVAEARGLIDDASVSKNTKTQVSIVHGDAATFRLPPRTKPSRFVFLFNPFGQETLNAFMSNNAGQFTSRDVFGLSLDVYLLPTLIRYLPGCNWLRNDSANCSLIFPAGVNR